MTKSVKSDPVYPTHSSVELAEEACLKAVPVETKNEMISLMKSYKNTILNSIQIESRKAKRKGN